MAIRLLGCDLVGGEMTGKKIDSVKIIVANHFSQMHKKFPTPGGTLLPSTKFDLCSGFLVNSVTDTFY